MSRRLPPLNAVRAFEAAARLGGVKRAAAELFVTPSAVSHQVKALEGFLGVALFRRAGRQIAPTTAGVRYLTAVKQALDELDVATRRVMAPADATVVNVSVAPSFLTRWLMPRVRDFQERHPEIELRLSPNSDPIDFAWSDIDIAIYFGEGDWADVDAVFLHPVVLIPVCSPAYLGGRTIASLQDLCRQTLIDVSTRPNEWDDFLASFGMQRPRQGKRLGFSSTALAVGAAMEDLGVALADRRLIAREVRYGHLVMPLDVQLPTRQGFYLVYQAGRELSDGMRCFYDWVIGEIAQQPNDPS
ncbi:MAG: transcriptional regulator GcvA [Gammaproteobacteria bacterium]|nr:transcriptional regulator GcvA [Gammaproteobacteria bacterium]